jgi:transcriptional regulator with XRE-family HTH domain
MGDTVVIPAQIRAGRALLGWSQEQLAEKAEVGMSSVRDIENLKRSNDTGAFLAVCRALENGGVEFVPGNVKQGPGVRMVAGRPNITRFPTVVTMFDGMPFKVEWQGREHTVFLPLEALEDLGRLNKRQPDVVYLKIFEQHQGAILDAARRALGNPERFDRDQRVHIRGKDISSLWE